MSFIRHGKFLVQLSSRLGAFNCYLVRDPDGLTLIDTGPFGFDRTIINTARITRIPIVRIALTHAHMDHIGSLEALHKILPKAEIGLLAREARILGGDFQLAPGEPQRTPPGLAASSITPTRLLQDGDEFGSLQVIATPGHTPGHAAFFDPRERTLIAGDAFQTAGGLAIAGTLRPFFPFPALGTWDSRLAQLSAQKVLALRPARLATGHGPVLDLPLPALERLVAQASPNRPARK